MHKHYEKRLAQAKNAIDKADYILIGGGAGLSDAAGLTYAGPRFTENFRPFIETYGFEDLYTSSFYPFQTQEERWAYWAKHISINRYEPPAAQLYRNLLSLMQGKDYFALTTNVEYQFHKAGFPDDRVFMVQGDYGYFQCEKGCHETLYYNEESVATMIAHTKDCRIPTSLVPKCPHCAGEMDAYVHHGQYFIRDKRWHDAKKRYRDFVKCCQHKQVVYLELGVGFNTPTIIRVPFEQMTYQNKNATLIRMNRDYPEGARENGDKTVAFHEEMTDIVQHLLS